MMIFKLNSNLFQYEKIKKVDNEMQMKANEKKTEKERERERVKVHWEILPTFYEHLLQ